jgi:hypothetical protein
MSNEWQGEERRAHPRVSLKDRKNPSRVVPSTIVDLSLSGALLEVGATLPTKSRYTVRLEADGTPLELSGEVVRSYVHGFEKDEKGLPAVKYRAAIAFVDMDPETRDDLERLLVS